jgi:peptide subunit release factor 1 (eRF1)
VVGVSDTLQAVNEGRVQVLVVNEGFKLSGYACEDCDMLATDPKICEPCHTLATPIDDMIDLAVIRVLRQGGHVEVVHPLASLEKAGNVAAQLRY